MSKERELIKDMKILLECTYIGGLQRNADVLIGRAIELLAQPETEQEPVAWMYERQIEGFTERTMSVGFEENFDGVTIPLYASPPKRKPLSEDEIDKAYRQSCGNYCQIAFKDGVRFAEQYYGITEGEE